MLKHVVMLKLREGCDASRCHELVMDCRRHIPDVLAVSAGLDIMRLPSSFDYCFTLDFADYQGLRNYEASDFHQLIRREVRRIRTVSYSVDYLE